MRIKGSNMKFSTAMRNVELSEKGGVVFHKDYPTWQIEVDANGNIEDGDLRDLDISTLTTNTGWGYTLYVGVENDEIPS